jgi:hypothetical protein
MEARKIFSLDKKNKNIIGPFLESMGRLIAHVVSYKNQINSELIDNMIRSILPLPVYNFAQNMLLTFLLDFGCPLKMKNEKNQIIAKAKVIFVNFTEKLFTNYYLILYFFRKVKTDSSAKQNLYEALM